MTDPGETCAAASPHRRAPRTSDGGRTCDIATELAVHFERSQDYQQAVQYREQATQTALQLLAYHEVIDHLTKGLELLEHLPDTPERRRHALQLLTAQGPALLAARGYAAPEVEQVDQLPEL